METEEIVDIAQKGCLHEEFLEAGEVKVLTDSLSRIYNDQIAVELAIERFTKIVDDYQEQPHLMDPYLEEMLACILNIARKTDHDPKLSHLAFKFLYLLTKARGLKTVVRLLPHEVADLEPVLNFIYQQDASDCETWETRYMLLLWMSIICMIPFDMARLDSNAQTASGEVKEPTMLRILNIGKRYLSVSDKCRDAASWMVAKFLTRQDVKNEQLPDFMDWSLKTMTEVDLETMPGMTTLSGIMMALAQLFKQGKREDLMEYADILLAKMIELDLFQVHNTTIRKFAIKLNTRLGLTFLKARVAAWRYKRGSRSLAENLKSYGSAKTGVKVPEKEEEDEDYDVPEEVEDVIEKLLVGLRDTDTVVRWSAAKGVGRITNRLPQELADQVVQSVLELFSSVERDEAWHGGCLALAELGRRGLLLPERLPEVVPVVLKALLYDEKRGACSVGSHVRDAACYVCWSFARAYDPEVVKGHVNKIATALVIATVFDREVNCRKAASAAFQENVGRQGTFPHGIDIITTADYFAVGSKVNTYLNISVYIAQFEEYTRAMIDHLVTVKIAHWDSIMRDLTSQALHKLTAKDPEYMKSKVVMQLIPLCTGIDLNSRHGATLAVAEVIYALSLLAQSENRTIADYLDSESVSALKKITVTMENSKMFKGATGEILRPAACELIQKLSLSKLPCPEQDTIDHWQSLLDDGIINTLRTESDIHDKAVLALRELCNQYYQLENGQPNTEKQDEILNRYMTGIKSNVEFSRMGATMALGVLPKFFLLGKVDKVIESLITAAAKTRGQLFAEARRDAFTAISSICKTVGVSTSDTKDCITPAQLKTIFAALFEGMKDYTTDSRGDVGAWVREACMVGLSEIMQLVIKVDQSLLDQDVYILLIQNLIQQAAEKIDRTRNIAGGTLLRLLHQDSPVVPYIPHREELVKIFPKSDIELLNWGAPSDCFPKLTQLLALDQYRYHVMLGLTVSVGGLSESLVKHSGSSMLSYLKDHSSAVQLKSVADVILKIFKDFQKVDRVSLPVMKMADLLVSSGSFDNLVEDGQSSFPSTLLQILKAEISKSGDAQKLLISIDLFCSLLQFEGNIRKKCLSKLLLFLCHRYPKIRKTTANKLYEALLVYDDVITEENSDSVQEILSETNWQDSISVVRPIRNKLCDLVGIAKPVAKTNILKTKEEDMQT